mmetsp:Transcript_9128/g.10582  ORF Transcript_9128/g.10582 Transcript_9128/m.10582 type:complete len:693 (+) Transcript_9128:321-2399(+)
MGNSVPATFSNWKPIPFKLGIISFSMSLLFATFLISGPLDLLQDKLSARNVSRESDGLCETDDFDSKMKDFKEHIDRNITNYTMSKIQNNLFSTYREALLNDTELYGESKEYKCPGDLGTKDSYYDAGKNRTHGPFFPGYCLNQLQKNMLDEYTTMCQVNKKVCIDDWGLSILCKTITVDVPCHTLDSSKAEQSSATLDDHRAEERDIANQDVTIQSDADKDSLNHLQNKAAKILGRLLKQINIAGIIYSIYIVMALYFPTPLQLFRPPLMTRAKGLMFGAGKVTFIVIVLIGWNVYIHVSDIIRAPEFKIYLKNVFVDPCFVDGDFIGARASFVHDVCEDLINFENQLGFMKLQTDQLNRRIDQFYQNCNCGEYLEDSGYSLSPTLFDISGSTPLELYGFENRGGFHYMPDSTAEFVGNENICSNATYAREEILVADDTGLSFWELWIASGLVAKLIVQVAISNFGLALLKLADPFCVCNGTYESPPNDMGTGESDEAEVSLIDDDKDLQNEITRIKANDLKAIAIRETVIWGFLANSSLLSLFVAAIPNFDGFHRFDYIIFGVLILISILIPIGCMRLTRKTERSILLVSTGDTEEDEQESGMLDRINLLKKGSKPQKTMAGKITESIQNSVDAILPSPGNSEFKFSTPLRSIKHAGNDKSVFTTTPLFMNKLAANVSSAISKEGGSSKK